MVGNLPNATMKSGAKEGMQAAITPKDVSTEDHNCGRADVSE